MVGWFVGAESPPPGFPRHLEVMLAQLLQLRRRVIVCCRVPRPAAEPPGPPPGAQRPLASGPGRPTLLSSRELGCHQSLVRSPGSGLCQACSRCQLDDVTLPKP